MAEFVEARVEDTIPEIEEMERLGLIFPAEIKKLVQKRREHEYQLARRTKCRTDFVNYVVYEKKLIDLLKIRREKIGIREKRREIEIAIGTRVLKQLRTMTRLWPGHLDLWTMRMDFAKYMGWKEEVSVVYPEMVRFHGDKESVWILWAQWEIEGRKNYDKARQILLTRAPEYHPKSQSLRRELFRLELLFLESLHIKAKMDNLAGLEEVVTQNREKVLKCAIPRVIFEDSLETFKSPSLCMEMYQIANKFQFAHELREQIFRNMCKMFPDEVHTWKLKVSRVAQGLSVDVTVEENSDSVTEESTQLEGMNVKTEAGDKTSEKEMVQDLNSNILGEVKDGESEGNVPIEEGILKMEIKKEKEKETGEDLQNVTGTVKSTDNEHLVPKELLPGEKVSLVIDTLEKALNALDSSFVPTFIEELLSILKQCWGHKEIVKNITENLLKVFESHSKDLTPLHFCIWAALLQSMGRPVKEQQEVLRSALTFHSNCQSIRLKYYQLHILESPSIKHLLKEYKNVADGLTGENATKAWMETQMQIVKDKFKLKFFEESNQSLDDGVAKMSRFKHLEWINFNKGVLEAIELYNKLKFLPPFSPSLHSHMVQLLLKQDKVNVEQVRDVFETAIQQFGSTHTGLWLSYIEFERQFGDQLKVGPLYSRAKVELEDKLMHDFVELNQALKEIAGKGKKPVPIESILVMDDKENDQENIESTFMLGENLVTIFSEEENTLLHSDEKARKMFFNTISDTEGSLKNEHKKQAPEDGDVWRPTLKSLCGQDVWFNIRNVTVPADGETLDTVLQKKNRKKFTNSNEATDKLQCDSLKYKSLEEKDQEEVQDILKKSAILQPDFMNKTRVDPYFVGKKKAKKDMQKQREMTKGPGWFDMKAPELTEEVKRDLEILQMRSVLDPTRHYKNSDMKTLPKYFQMGKVEDSAVDFYSSRIPKRERKRNLADEIMHDEGVLRYQKRKYSEIVAAKQKKQFRHPPKGKKKGEKPSKKRKTGKSGE
ncbi:U3 small nucleolar RNA-associated protein 6 homolog [Oratosquilla oratoria]|uniref:U3 small nucleolar RNA-associated protein 6 homolog n=1 Tax=Oratosquilla oratoria TaxID=337810 RepID=UPI003F76A241